MASEKTRKYDAAHRIKNRERIRATAKRFYGRNPEYWKRYDQEYHRKWRKTAKGIASYRRGHLRRKYNISLEDYQELLDAQGGVCKGCRQPESVISAGNVPNLLAVDHDHATNRIRGLLCVKCNRIIGLANDNPAILLALAEYIA